MENQHNGSWAQIKWVTGKCPTDSTAEASHFIVHSELASLPKPQLMRKCPLRELLGRSVRNHDSVVLYSKGSKGYHRKQQKDAHAEWLWRVRLGPDLFLTDIKVLVLQRKSGSWHIMYTRICSFCFCTHPVPKGIEDFLERHLRQGKYKSFESKYEVWK